MERTLKMSIRWLVLASPLLAACGAQPTVSPATPAPDLGKRFVAANGMVSAAHPQASEAGVEMLRRGGNAVDAAVATAFTLGVGEPQMSGLGGGGGMLIWLQREGRAEYVDFYSAQHVASWRGVAPLDSGVASLRVVGIPGAAAGLLEAHERYGKLSRAEVLAPAIRLAEEGFPVNQILADMIAGAREKLSRFPESKRLFFPNDEPLGPGDILRNPELAEALRRVAAGGPSGFYQGETARELVQVLNRGSHPASLADLAAYRPQWKRPLCTEYRGYVVLSAPPPQTGLQLVHTLNLLERHDLRALGYPTQSAEAFDVMASAIRVANTDNRVNDDPNWASVPAAEVASKRFAAERSALVGTGQAIARIPRIDSLRRFEAVPPSPQCAPLNPYGPVQAANGDVNGRLPSARDTAHAGETSQRGCPHGHQQLDVRLRCDGVRIPPE
jgi:gamma-glutamyltranspeptidase/glutathione hydrolase